jgi:hypothetical protein
MGIGSSILLIALGAILDFAVSTQVSGIDLQTVGVILMIVGGLGLIVSMVNFNTWGGSGFHRRSTAVYTDASGQTTSRQIDDKVT